MKKITCLLLLALSTGVIMAQNIGINTSNPQGLLHVDVANNATNGILFTGTYNFNSSTVPNLGTGSRLMFYPGKAAFRAGQVFGTSWDNSNVGIGSTAFGLNNIAKGAGSLASGGESVASGNNSVAIGFETRAMGSASFALGSFVIASGESSFATGQFANAKGDHAAAFGSSSARSRYSSAFGLQSIAKGYASTALGLWNDSLLVDDEIAVSPTTPLLIVGNGNASDSRSNAFVVQKNGNVAVGNLRPNNAALLHIGVGSNVGKGLLVTGTFDYTNGTVPNLGTGSRLMFFPGKAAFRAGNITGNGWDNANVGQGSAAFGNGNVASGSNSFAAGGECVASGSGAMAMGFEARAVGQNSFSFGAFPISNGLASIAVGQYVRTDGNYSVAFGNGSQARADHSFAVGLYNVAKGFASTVVGQYNDSLLLGATPTTAANNTPLFTIGNGNDYNNRSNALVVQKDGNTAIGNFAPQYRLDLGGRMRIRSSANTAGIWMNKNDNSGLAAFFGIDGNNNMGFYGGVSNSWDVIVNATNGNMGIGTQTPLQKLHVVGNICYTGSSAACSDIRYKTNLAPLTSVLAAVLQIQPIYYDWKKTYREQGFSAERQLGFSAQEIERFFPEIVQINNDGYKAVDYSRMTPVLVQAVKEQQSQIELLKQENEALKQEVKKFESLQNRLEAIEKKLAQH